MVHAIYQKKREMLLPYTDARCPLSLLWPQKYLSCFMSGTLRHSVLGLAGMELICSTAAQKMLCCGSVTKTVLITHPCLSCC